MERIEKREENLEELAERVPRCNLFASVALALQEKWRNGDFQIESRGVLFIPGLRRRGGVPSTTQHRSSKGSGGVGLLLGNGRKACQGPRYVEGGGQCRPAMQREEEEEQLTIFRWDYLSPVTGGVSATTYTMLTPCTLCRLLSRYVAVDAPTG